MDFFAHQDQARKRTGHLILLFSAAVLSLIVLLNLLLAFVLWGMDNHLVGKYQASVQAAHNPDALFNTATFLDYITLQQWLLISAGVIVVVGGASLVKWMMLRGGGRRVAESLGGRLLLPDSRDFYERRLLNVIEEMAIASGMPVPLVYVMDDHSINAFAAGYQPSDAVIGVTRGCMEKLSREQLQGVMAHEFSHIFNGDMRLNIRLMAVLFGILFIGLIGRFILDATSRRRYVSSSNRDKNSLPFFLFGLGLVVIGYGGVLFGNLIKAAVSRQREFLADASAVQFTRNPQGIAGALQVIGYGAGSEISSPEREETAHMFFGQALPFRFSGFATHPPLDERIQRIDPNWNGQFMAPQRREQAEQESADIVAALQLSGGAALAMAAAPAAAAASSIPYEVVSDEAPQDSDQQALQTLAAAARDTYTARVLLAGLLLAPAERMVHEMQLDLIRQQEGQDFYRQILRQLPLVKALNPAQRLPLVELAMPALKQLSVLQYQDFRKLLVQLAKADGEIDIFEWCLYRLTLQYLNPHFETVAPVATRYAKEKDISDAISSVLSVLAWYGANQQQQAAEAFAKGAQAAGFTTLTLQQRTSSLKPLNLALTRLSEAYPHLKGRLIKAMQACMDADGRQKGVELDLVRTIAAIMEVPVQLNEQGVA
ncbi:M48 family metallopeptidase [Thalassolituus marinus]|uniref:M48 family metalloprotease n=1 Tax=Thalassolituus marinus TaxID=671053 RepID=A0ABS7ZKZ5_9GAMM|nr:M48 family metallopeptidase [Thalassolituus marinus]MCA6062399.1 M48 family metalloprotease [Thalassolituus marinus]